MRVRVRTQEINDQGFFSLHPSQAISKAKQFKPVKRNLVRKKWFSHGKAK
jgi:hypothetical protein